MEYLRGQAFEGRRGALPCDAKTREFRQVTPPEIGGAVGKTFAPNHILQLRLRTRSLAAVVYTAFDEWDSYSHELGEQLYRYFRASKLDEPLRAGIDINTIHTRGAWRTGREYERERFDEFRGRSTDGL